MRFKNDRQRKAVMAQYASGKDYSHHNPQKQAHEPMLPTERRQMMMRQQMNKEIHPYIKSLNKYSQKIFGKNYEQLNSSQREKIQYIYHSKKDSDKDGILDYKKELQLFKVTGNQRDSGLEVTKFVLARNKNQAILNAEKTFSKKQNIDFSKTELNHTKNLSKIEIKIIPKKIFNKLVKDKNFVKKQNLLRKKHGLKEIDSDKDGVPDHKDCAPFNPKKQGLLHEVHVKMLRKQEEKLERARENALRKLEDTKDRLREKQAISDKKATISQLKLQQKQAIIDEANREKEKLHDLKQANADAKKQLDALTLSGKTKTFLKKTASRVGRQAADDSRIAFQRTAAFIRSGKIQKTLKKINKHIPG